MSFLRRAAQQIAETRGADPRLPWGDSTPPTNSMVGASGSGIRVTQSLAEGISAVYGCCALLADSVSSLPLELRNGPTRKDSKPLPQSPLLKQPYAEISRRDWWVGFIWALALRGNFYGRIIQRDGDGFPVQVKPIHNDAVQLQRNTSTGALEYRFYGETIPLTQVFHVRYQTPPGSSEGINPIQAQALTFGNAVAQQRFVESFFLNSANPMGVIQVPGPLDHTETRKMLRGWVAGHQGLNKANLPAVLTEGAVFQPITISPRDSMLLEALGFSESQICGRIFRIPPHMVGIAGDTVSRPNIEEQERSFFTNTLVGYLEIGTEALTACHPAGQYVYFDTTTRERGNTLVRAQASALLMNSGVAIADDVRAWFDWPALPDGDGQESYMPINTQLLEAALLALKQAKAMPLVPPAAPSSNGKAPGEEPHALAGAKPAERSANGHEMSVDQAWHIVESALTQAKKMRSAAELAGSVDADPS